MSLFKRAPESAQPNRDQVPGSAISVLFNRETSTPDRARALQAFGATVRTHLQDATAAAGRGGEIVAERSGQLLSEVVDRLPIRRAAELSHAFGTDPQVRAGQVIDDAATLARWLWVAAKAIPAPEPAVHAAKVILHLAIEIRMVGELLEAYRDSDVDSPVVPLPTILATWASGVPGGPAWSASTVATTLVTHVRRALTDLRGDDGRIKGIMNRGREGGDIVRALGESMSMALRQPAST